MKQTYVFTKTYAIDAGLLSGGLMAASNIGDMAIQASQNAKQRKWQEKMYSRQRADALADWSMQNAYNSPEQQMARLKTAGLNPNLVYGHGADAMSVGTVRSSSAGNWSPAPLRTGLGDIMSAYMDTELRQAQISNLEQQKQTGAQMAAKIATDAALNVVKSKLYRSQTGKTDLEAEMLKIRNEYLPSLLSTSLEAARATINKTNAQTGYVLDENERREALTAQNLQTAAERIALMRAQRLKLMPAQVDEIRQRIENMKKDGSLKQYEIDLNNKGVQKNDPAWLRALGRLIGIIMPDGSTGAPVGGTGAMPFHY